MGRERPGHKRSYRKEAGRKEAAQMTLQQKEELITAKYKPGCICKGIKLAKIMEAINDGAVSFREVAKKTGIGNGSCESKRCGEKVDSLLKESEQ